RISVTVFPIRHILFFFSSRRRHTSFSRDWSSDVCSSDLAGRVEEPIGRGGGVDVQDGGYAADVEVLGGLAVVVDDGGGGPELDRSEERRVGKESRFGETAYDICDRVSCDSVARIQDM